MGSTLKSLIRSTRNQRELAKDGDFTLTTKLEEYFLWYSRNQPPRPDGESWETEKVWHPSSISRGMCPRAAQIQTVRKDLVEKRSPPDPGLLRIFMLGNAIHHLYQTNVLGPMGVLWGRWVNLEKIVISPDGRGRPTIDMEQSEVHEGFMPEPQVFMFDGLRKWMHVEFSVWSEEYNIGGHTDGILKIDEWPDAILEVKSANERSFNYRTEPMGYHISQANLYMECEKLEHALVLYVDKNRPMEKDFWITKDQQVLKPMLEACDKANKGIKREELTPMLTECKRSNSARCRKCPAAKACLAVGAGSVGWKKLEKL